MHKGSVSIYFVRSALQPVLERGLDPSGLLLSAGISLPLLHSPQARVTAETFSAVWLGVAELLDDELFGQDTRRMKVGSFAMMCSTLIACATLRHALHRMVRCFNLLLDDFHCALESEGAYASLTIRRDANAPGSGIFGYETLLMMQHGLACWLIGRRIHIIRAAFAYAEPSRSAEYPRMYSENLSFEQDATALVFDIACLDLPVLQNDRTIKSFLRGAPANIVLKYKNSGGLATQIRRSLRAHASNGWPDHDEVALQLRMSVSTLRRRLMEEGQTFQGIKDLLRRDMAIEQLCHTTRSVADIAGVLGFADASAFHRAFKKWTGSNPGAYRLQMQAGGIANKLTNAER